MGWLIRQHDKIETAFQATEFSQSSIYDNVAMAHPISIAWCSDDTPIPFPHFKLFTPTDADDEASFVVWQMGYKSSQVRWTATYGERVTREVLTGMDVSQVTPHLRINNLWALLATINDLPVRIEFVEPSKGYITRGSYRKFLKHSIVHLTVPETMYRKLALKTSTLLRRRAHQVRGHWRIDWRQRPSKLCEHDWGDDMVCRLCHGHQILVPEHQRGDSSLGFVLHDYEVHHDADTKKN